jgi:hypothetical protein
MVTDADGRCAPPEAATVAFAQLVENHIDAVILESVSVGDRQAVAEALARELARLTAASVVTGSRAADRVDVGIATAVHESFTSRHAR